MTSDELERFSLMPNDIVSIRANGSRDLVGRFIVFESENSWAYCDHFIRIESDVRAVLPRYIFLWGQTRLARTFIESRMVSTAGQNTVSQVTLSQLPIPLPPLTEQVRIAAEAERRLSVAQQTEAAIEANLQRAARLRQSILT